MSLSNRTIVTGRSYRSQQAVAKGFCICMRGHTRHPVEDPISWIQCWMMRWSCCHLPLSAASLAVVHCICPLSALHWCSWVEMGWNLTNLNNQFPVPASSCTQDCGASAWVSPRGEGRVHAVHDYLLPSWCEATARTHFTTKTVGSVGDVYDMRVWQ